MEHPFAGMGKFQGAAAGHTKDHFGIAILWDSHQDKDPKASHTPTEAVPKSFQAPDPAGADGILGCAPSQEKEAQNQQGFGPGEAELPHSQEKPAFPKENQHFSNKQPFSMYF